MDITSDNIISFPSYSEIVYIDVLMRAALEQNNTQDFRELIENLKRTERGIASNSMIKQFLTVLSMTNSTEKLSVFLDYIHTPFRSSFSKEERNDYARPITDAMVISIISNDLKTARQLLNDRNNTFLSATPMYFVMLTKNYSLIPDCLEFINRNMQSHFFDSMSRLTFFDELSYVVASAAVHRDSEFLTELFGCGYKPSALAIAFLTNRPESFDFLLSTYLAFTGKQGSPSDFIRTALSPEDQLNFVLCEHLLHSNETLPELMQKYGLPKKFTAILSSDIQFLESRSACCEAFKKSIKAHLSHKLTVVIDDNYVYFALHSFLPKSCDITLDVRKYDSYLFDTYDLDSILSHKLIVEPTQECCPFVKHVLTIDTDGSMTRLLTKNGGIHEHNISNAIKIVKELGNSAALAVLEEYKNEQ